MINCVETFVKNELEQMISYWRVENQQVIHDADFYGSFHSNHSTFKFSMGEKILLQETNAYVKGVIEEKGLKYFSLQAGDVKKSKISFKGTFLIPNVGRFFTNLEATQNIERSTKKKCRPVES